ncbi:MAG: 50S ribosomal protein L13 [Candidatus Woesearchaeota archaeon]|jgi:large subunit ribosomal protein L13|nr:50S ribosomal protein L13 [Candidatus Woesearchaeota archaeon]MDP7198803.1 50S ribosomal protein L13 [Candidatus Woesearchaeota archaeon]MDP7467197.1 50S ribosomal protein L13 [Candidatus Woesearchaeota archaeon]MDP7647468.1 50S ribosomal protein L13 [Candidatus Woesearchaeota archaeon]
MDININGKGMIVGRLASFVAKQALLGHNVRVFNCESLYFTGKKEAIVGHYQHKFYGRTKAYKGPYGNKMPDRFFRRVVKGMLPHGGKEKSRGRVALSKVSCFLGIPEKFKNDPLTPTEACAITKSQAPSVLTVAELMKNLGAKA